MTMIEISYIIYIAISVVMTVWVAKFLSHYGRDFLVGCFNNNEKLADSINHLLVAGFYLINFGYILYALKTGGNPATIKECIEYLSSKLGFVILVIGFMHLFNIYIITKWRAKSARLIESSELEKEKIPLEKEAIKEL